MPSKHHRRSDRRRATPAPTGQEARESTIESAGILSRIAGGLLAFAFFAGPLAFIPDFYEPVLTSKRLVFHVVLSAVLMLAGIRALIHSGKVTALPRSLLTWAALLLLAWSLLTLLWGHTTYFAERENFKYLLACSLFFATSCGFISSQAVHRAMTALLAAAIVNSLVTGGQYWLAWDFLPQHAAPAGVFGNRNDSAEFTASALPIAFGWFLRARSTMGIVVRGAAGALLFVTVLLAYARAAQLAVVAVASILTFGFWLHRRRTGQSIVSRRHLPGALAGLCVVTAALLLPPRAMPSIWSGTTEKAARSLSSATGGAVDSSIGFRTTLWGNSIVGMTERPLTGFGIGNWSAVYPRFAQAWRPDRMIDQRHYHYHAHNFFVEKLVELGFVGAALSSFFLLAAARASVIAVRSYEAHARDAVTALYFAATAIAIGITAFFSMPLNYEVAPFLLAAVLGWLNATAIRHATPPQTLAPRQAMHARLLSGAAAIVIALAGFWLASKYGNVALWSGRADHATARRDPAAVSLAQRALRHDPYDPPSNIRLYQQWNSADPVRALVHLRRLANVYPHMPTVLGMLGKTYTRMGDFSQALVQWQTLLQLLPDLEEPMRECAWLTARLQHFDESLAYCRRLVELWPENLQYRKSLENVLNRAASPAAEGKIAPDQSNDG